MTITRSTSFLALLLAPASIACSQQPQGLRKEWTEFQMVLCRSEAIVYNNTGAIRLTVSGSTDDRRPISFQAIFDSTGTPLNLKNTDGMSLEPQQGGKPYLEIQFGSNAQLIAHDQGQPVGAPVSLSIDEKTTALAIMEFIWGRRCGRGRRP